MLAEKIENLRRSSEQLLKDAVGADPEVASNLVVNPDSDDTRCTAATAPGKAWLSALITSQVWFLPILKNVSNTTRVTGTDGI